MIIFLQNHNGLSQNSHTFPLEGKPTKTEAATDQKARNSSDLFTCQFNITNSFTKTT